MLNPHKIYIAYSKYIKDGAWNRNPSPGKRLSHTVNSTVVDGLVPWVARVLAAFILTYDSGNSPRHLALGATNAILG